MHVHLFDKEAISWDAVTLVEVNDVTNNKVLDVDSLAGAILATEDSNFFVHDFLTESQELLLLTPVTESLDGSGEENGEVDGGSLDPRSFSSEDAQDEGDGGEDEQQDDIELIELVPKDGPEGANLRKGSLVFTEAKLKERAKLRKFETIFIITISIVS